MSSMAMLACLLLSIGGGFGLAEQLLRKSSDRKPFPLRTQWLNVGLVLFAVVVAAVLLLGIASISITERLTQVAAVAGLSIILVAGLLTSDRTSLGRLIWNGGLLLLATGDTPALWWLAVTLVAVPRLAFENGESTTGSSWRSPLLWFSLTLWTLGFAGWGTPFATDATTRFAAIVIVSGLGGLLGWFPFPRVQHLTGQGMGDLAGESLLPALTTGVVLFQLMRFRPLDDPALMTVATFSLFSLALVSVRLFREDRLTRRLGLVSLTILNSLVLASVLAGWAERYPDADWGNSSNLLTGTELFSMLMLTETAGWLLVAAGATCLSPQNSSEDFEETLAGVCGRHPFASVPLLAGILCLAGMPPLPGFFWRCSLMASLILPYRVSQWTSLTEPHRGFLAMAVVATGCGILIAIAHLRLAVRLAFEEPFRHRDPQRGWRSAFAVVVAMIIFTAVAVRPFTVIPEAMQAERETNPSEIHAPG